MNGGHQGLREHHACEIFILQEGEAEGEEKANERPDSPEDFVWRWRQRRMVRRRGRKRRQVIHRFRHEAKSPRT